jgi:hypothetical protein
MLLHANDQELRLLLLIVGVLVLVVVGVGTRARARQRSGQTRGAADAFCVLPPRRPRILARASTLRARFLRFCGGYTGSISRTAGPIDDPIEVPNPHPAGAPACGTSIVVSLPQPCYKAKRILKLTSKL